MKDYTMSSTECLSLSGDSEFGPADRHLTESTRQRNAFGCASTSIAEFGSVKRTLKPCLRVELTYLSVVATLPRQR